MRTIEADWILKPGIVENGWIDPDLASRAKPVKSPTAAARLLRAMRRRGRELVDQARLGLAIVGSVVNGLAAELAPRQARYA